MDLRALLLIIAVLLFLILWRVSDISARLKERFPREKEQDRLWAKDDPMGHYEAHKNDKKE